MSDTTNDEKPEDRRTKAQLLEYIEQLEENIETLKNQQGMVAHEGRSAAEWHEAYSQAQTELNHLRASAAAANQKSEGQMLADIMRGGR